ncbi:MAG: DNA recombination protein RmuC, partial [Candidatus Zixiibacteriota bacterium]
MDSITITLIAIIIINLALTVWMIIRNRHNTVEPLIKLEALISSFKVDLISKQLEGLSSLRESFDNTSRLINDRLAESTSTLDRRMATVGEIENKLGQLSTQTKNIEDIGKNIQSLSKLLKPPKLRGNLGELLLENLLAQILPKALFDTQYRFNDGSRVDTVV